MVGKNIQQTERINWTIPRVSPMADGRQVGIDIDIGRRGVNIPRALLLGVLLGLLQACTSLGPKAISEGRPAYNEAIAATNAEQYLSWVVRMRYGLPTSQLAVSSITANMRFSSTVGVNVGVGPGENYVGNLVPLSGGVTYDENPTISYVPLQGEKHLRSLMSPVPTDILGLLLNMNFQPGPAMAVVVKRINGVPNHDFLNTPEQKTDRRFTKLVAVINRLSRADKLAFIEAGEQTKTYHVWLHDYLPDNREDAEDFMNLLSIDGVALDGSDVSLPVIGALRRSTNKSIAIQTRSVLDIGRIAAASVDVPDADLEQGRTVAFPEPGPVGKFIQVRRGAERPPSAMAATRFEDWWYYIAGDDLFSKQYFILFMALMSVQLTETASESRAPVLTVPVN
jgi:hypothetical protein